VIHIIHCKYRDLLSDVVVLPSWTNALVLIWARVQGAFRAWLMLRLPTWTDESSGLHCLVCESMCDGGTSESCILAMQNPRSPRILQQGVIRHILESCGLAALAIR
jgi:hypothetical protein